MFFGQNGLGATLSDTIGLAKPFWTGGDVWWVDSNGGGVDAASPAGKDREKPLLTLGQAYTNAASGDVIVLKDGHTETLTAQLNLAKNRLTIIGDGSSGGLPTVKLYSNSAAAGLLALAGSGIQLRNIYFPQNVQSNNYANGRVFISGDRSRLVGCYFECGANDVNSAVGIAFAVGSTMLENCTFISTATASATRPARGLQELGAISDTYLRGCVFNDGAKGFATASCDLAGGAHTGLCIENVSLLNGADMLLLATGSTGWWISGITQTGGGRVTIT